MDDFGDKEIARVYFAGRLSEARLVEGELDEQNIDYAIEVEPHLHELSAGAKKGPRSFPVVSSMDPIDEEKALAISLVQQ